MADYDVVVIGAGCGGLSAASQLARQGRKVLVLEQADRIGGCCSTFEREGYRFDVGASIVEEIQPIEMAFEMLGTRLQDEVDLIPCDPMMSFILEDGFRVTYPISLEETEQIISDISPMDGKSFKEFARYFAGFTAQTMKGFFVSPADTMVDMARLLLKTPGLLKYAPLFSKSYQDVIIRYFKDEKVQSTMSYQSLYVGLPPELCPGIFALLSYSEHEGIYYPRGGMIKIPEAFRRVGKSFGMEVRLNQKVDRVLVRDRRVEGVALADGTEITAPVVVSNINAKTLYLNLIGEDKLPWLARYGIKSYEYSKSVPMVYLGIDYEPPLEAHHSVVALDFEGISDYWWNYVTKGKLRQEPFGLVCWPTHADPSLAPEGHHVLNLIPEGSYELSGTDWDREKQPFIDRTIEFLSKQAIPGLADHVKVIDCATPLDFERRLLLPHGAIYDLQQDLTSEVIFRPSGRSRSVKGLYLAGNSTHPGGGVPTTIASGIIASKLVDKYE
ncbi:MAG: NAD(P)/FAD-dependent oxidoreductase [Actinomycetota bacterium]|nr:NAD(P)/FAD-dependent oxidoreductase [Actinomycetota bacterium]